MHLCVSSLVYFFAILRNHLRFTLFPYTTLFRSSTLTLDKTGTSYALTATASGLSPATSSVFSITPGAAAQLVRSEEHTSELQSHSDLVCRLLLEKKKKRYPLITNKKK